eukprot:CAMPEP_0119049266 /NCGR_PEP_ID=MMETSP1177-20130426/63806_1 /TAXON_ID=2985 /ORGANISM="Ochromonas sp, Strain CCMP1899" /LENGTH=87 /DNA_ID=CAMNT_0007026293 /DNA_START=137 /DNA_END=396 /DNA_ORIENTATION=+
MKSHVTPSKGTPNPNRNTPSKNTPGRNTPSKNGIKNVMFLSPMKSSKKSADGEGSERKGKNSTPNSTYAMITKRDDVEEDNDDEEAG